MKYSLTTTAQLVVEAKGYDRLMRITAGKFSTAVAVYLRYPNTQNIMALLDSDANSKVDIPVPAGRRVEAYTDAGTADLAVIKVSGETQQMI